MALNLNLTTTENNSNKLGCFILNINSNRIFSSDRDGLALFKETEIKEIVEKTILFTLDKMSDGSNDFIINRAMVNEFLADVKAPHNVDYCNAVNKLLFAERKNDKISALFASSGNFLDLPIPVRKTVIQTILQIFFGRLMAMFQIGIKNVLEKLEELKNKKVDTDIDVNEVAVFPAQSRVNNDVLRYVGGFVVRSLIRKKCPKSTVDRITKEDKLTMDETESWIQKISRGGLINISDEFYEMVLKIKQLSDKHYCVNYELLRNEKLKENATKEALADAQISKEWANLHKGDDSEKWLNKILDTFLNTRGKCLTRDITELFQHITKSSIRAKKALRRKLKEKEELEKGETKVTSLGKTIKTPKKKKQSMSKLTGVKSSDTKIQEVLTQSPARKIPKRQITQAKENNSTKFQQDLTFLEPPKFDFLIKSPAKQTRKSKIENKSSHIRSSCAIKSLKNSTNLQHPKESERKISKYKNIETPAIEEAKKNNDLSFLADDPDADLYLQFL